MQNQGILYSPADGEVIPLSTVSDHAFSSGFLGEGAAIIPSVGKICAVADATVVSVSNTLHAYNLKTDDGIEVLIHLGIDTVELRGDGFKSHVSAGDHVKKGDLIAEMDIEKITAKGYKAETPIVITNVEDHLPISHVSGQVQRGDEMIFFTK